MYYKNNKSLPYLLKVSGRFLWNKVRNKKVQLLLHLDITNLTNVMPFGMVNSGDENDFRRVGKFL